MNDSDSDWLITRPGKSKSPLAALFGATILVTVGGAAAYAAYHYYYYFRDSSSSARMLNNAIYEKEAKISFFPDNPRFFIADGKTPLYGIPFAAWVGFEDTRENGAASHGTSVINTYCRTTYTLNVPFSANGVYAQHPGWYSFPSEPHSKVCTVNPPGPPEPK